MKPSLGVMEKLSFGGHFCGNVLKMLNFTKFDEIPPFSPFSHFSAPERFWALGAPHAHLVSEISGPGSSSPDGVHGRARANQRGYSTRSRAAKAPPLTPIFPPYLSVSDLPWRRW